MTSKAKKVIKTTNHAMTSSIVLLYYLMSLISMRYFLIRFPAKISPPTRKNKLVIVIILNFTLQLLHGGGNIYHK